MTNIFATSEEKFLKTVVMYGKLGKLYEDKGCKVEVTPEFALNACLKGALIFATDTYYTVASVKESSGTVTVITNDTSDTTSNTTYTVTSA